MYVMKTNPFDLISGNRGEKLGAMLRAEITRAIGQSDQNYLIPLLDACRGIAAADVANALLSWSREHPDRIADRIVLRLKQIEEDYTIETDGKYTEMQRNMAKDRQEKNCRLVEGLLLLWGIVCDWPGLLPEMYDGNRNDNRALGTCASVEQIVKAIGKANG